MKTAIPKIVSLLAVLVRVGVVVRLLSCGPFGIVCGISEALVLLVTVRSLWAGVVCASGWGLLVPWLHMFPGLFNPEVVRVLPFGFALYLAMIFAQLVLRLYMGRACTVGVPVCSGVLVEGPYAMIRHPLALLEVLTRLVFLVAFFSPWNCVVSMLCMGAAVVCVLIEESFLNTRAEYRSYSARVRSRFVPGVW